jgi:hypothetical protein
MRIIEDGDTLFIVADNFVNLQESPSYPIPANSEMGQALKKDGIRGLAIEDLRRVLEYLNATYA